MRDKTKIFAKIYNEVGSYFNSITPTKDVEGNVMYEDGETGFQTFEWEKWKEPDKNRPILHKTNSPVELITFETACNEFIKEMEANILSYDEDVVIGIMKSSFGIIGHERPTHKQLFDANMEQEALLLSQYENVTNWIKRLFYDGCLLYSEYNEYKKKLINQIDSKQNEPKKSDTAKPKQITLHPELLQALQTGGYIENAEAKPLKWTATNSTTHNKILNKKSLLDLLCLLEYPDSVIKDKKLLKETFSIEFKANNYTDITDNNGNLKRPIISEYHNKLSDIVSKSK
ncbi:hypothetical protein EZS27_013640 [termite gut metagenome]|uniref:Uncharacterized protein n=1 Tax=termite gut metagenome TaxID=433724 RepID=A0A5J4RY79_9ZZZZ